MHTTRCREQGGWPLEGGMLAAYHATYRLEKPLLEHQVRTATVHASGAPHCSLVAESIIGTWRRLRRVHLSGRRRAEPSFGPSGMPVGSTK